MKGLEKLLFGLRGKKDLKNKVLKLVSEDLIKLEGLVLKKGCELK